MNFRFNNLRKPLHLEWSKEDLLNENKQIHFALKNKRGIVGSFCLKKINCTTIRLRQMAIEKKFQKKGYGSSILKFTEKFAINNNYKKIIIIARLSALDFYKKNLFKTSGKIFTDVTVSSINMYKKI
ncbi:GNAT family N-acetyltransferase [Methylophilaceae bacterium]|nr:GNAT family N-acetyltransferase [Methylophilaceae bacterium]